jgi:hypothetical protein
MKACPEKQEAIPEETEITEEHQKVPNEKAVQIIRTLKEQSGDKQLAMGYQNPWKRQTKGTVVRGAHKGWTFKR